MIDSFIVQGADLCVRAAGGSREGTYPGRHTGRPLQSRLQYPASPEERAGTEPRPYRAIRGAKQRADVVIGPYGEKGKPNRPPWPAAHSGASAARMQGMGGGGGRDHPQKCSATSDNPSVAAKPRQLPLHKGALACGGRGGHRPVIGVPSNPRRGGTEPAPYTSTESADLWADVPKAWLPPAKFRSEIWLAVIGIGPYERTRGYGFPRRFAPRNDSTNAGSRSAGPSSTSFSARRSVRNDRRHRSLPLSSHVSTSPVNARSEAPAPVSPKSP